MWWKLFIVPSPTLSLLLVVDILIRLLNCIPLAVVLCRIVLCCVVSCRVASRLCSSILLGSFLHHFHLFLPSKSQINFPCSQLIVSLLYTNHTICFGYTATFRCIMYIKMLKLLLKHNGSVNLLSKLTIIQVLCAKTIYIWKLLVKTKYNE
jgi:hypothetical protein